MAENKSNIDQLINESFQNSDFDFDFDNSSWGNVEQKLDTSTTIDKVVYSALTPSPSKLPDDAWENMNDALDIETVWKRLEKRSKRRPIIFWWKIAGVLLLIGLFTGQLINLTKPIENTSNTNFFKDVTNSKQDIETVPLLINSPKEIEINLNKTLNNYKESNVVKSNNNKGTINNSSPKKQKQNIYRSNESTLYERNIESIIITKIKPIEIKLITISFDKNITELADNLDSIVLPSKNRRLTIGFVGEVNNTWISDVETRLGYSKNSLVYNDFSITPSYGLYLDYKITSSLTFGSEIFINSIMKTKNNLYKNGELTKKETDLEYFKSSLSLSKDVTINKLRKGSFLQFSGGVYFSYLKRSFVKYDNVITKMNSDYKLFDYGIKVGISHRFDFNRINFSYGVQTSYGFKNVHDGENTPSYLNYTRNISYGLNIKLGYRL